MSEYNPMFMDELNQLRASELGIGAYQPENFYRVIGAEKGSLTAKQIYQDVLRTGQIRGSAAQGEMAFFSKGLYQPHYGYTKPNNLNYLIEATPEFNPNSNVLYKPNTSVKVRPLPSIGGIKAPEGLAFPVGGSGSRWITEVNGMPSPQGTYSGATSIDNPSFWQRINPANQAGLKMSEATLTRPSAVYPLEYNRYAVADPTKTVSVSVFEGGIPKWKPVFDYTKPFSETSLLQHGKNLTHISRSILAQPETQAVLNAATKAGGVAGLLLEAPENYYNLEKRDRAKARDAAKANWWQENMEGYQESPDDNYDRLARLGRASLDSALSTLTFGATTAQPERTGMSRYGEESGQELRRQIRRAEGNEWIK
jgi:hypothetical protein